MGRLATLWHSVAARARELARARLTPQDVGWAVGVGSFIGFLPIYGLHLPACVLAARQLKLNQVVTYGAAQVSNPFFAPFLVVGEVAVGELLLHGRVRMLDEESAHRVGWSMLRDAPGLFVSCLLGSLVIGAVLAPVLGAIATNTMRRLRDRKHVEA